MDRVALAIAGLGRMGTIHALHAVELARETGACAVTALVDADPERAHRFAAEAGLNIPIFETLPDLVKSRAAAATVAVTPTRLHGEHARMLAAAGHRILLEKPLTGSLESDRELAAYLDREHPDALMLAFQRRFDAPLQYAKQLLGEGAIGRLFKIYSALEDSNPIPEGYESSGILSDMSVHNVDEILWFTGRLPRAAAAIGARLYGHRVTRNNEDFDDALLYLWFDEELTAQVQVGRNHVSGYRVETILFGEEGQIQVGRFDQSPLVTVEAYGRRGRTEPIATRSFEMRRYGKPLPEFIDRFGPAYKAELWTFVECCRSGSRFPTTHRDGLSAQRVISAGMARTISVHDAAPVS